MLIIWDLEHLKVYKERETKIFWERSNWATKANILKYKKKCQKGRNGVYESWTENFF